MISPFLPAFSRRCCSILVAAAVDARVDEVRDAFLDGLVDEVVALLDLALDACSGAEGDLNGVDTPDLLVFAGLLQCGLCGRKQGWDIIEIALHQLHARVLLGDALRGS
jgi:hypothetical protein